MEVQFHKQTLRLLAVSPWFSAENLTLISECERKIGKRLSLAVREWYSLEGVEGVLDDPSCDNRMQRLPRFLHDFSKSTMRGTNKVYFYGAWRCNTGYSASIVIDGSDDPIVEEYSVPPARFLFTEYVQYHLWYRLVTDVPHLLTRNTDQPKGECGPHTLVYLDAIFEKMLPLTCDLNPWNEERKILRYYADGSRIEIETLGDPASGVREAQYHLAADTVDRLFVLYEKIWPVHGLKLRLADVPGIDFSETFAAFREKYPKADLHVEPYRYY